MCIAVGILVDQERTKEMGKITSPIWLAVSKQRDFSTFFSPRVSSFTAVNSVCLSCLRLVKWASADKDV